MKSPATSRRNAPQVHLLVEYEHSAAPATARDMLRELKQREAAELLLWTEQIRARSGAQVPAELADEEIQLRLAIEREIGSTAYAQLERMASMADETVAMDAALHLLESASDR